MVYDAQRIRIIFAMLGARGHYAVPRILHEAGFLKRFYTDSYIGNTPIARGLLGLIPRALQPELLRRWQARQDSGIPASKVRSFELLGIWYALARRRAERRGESANGIYRRAAVWFGRNILTQGIDNCDMVWTCNGTAQDIFRHARSEAIRCVMEQTILPKQLTNRLLQEENARWPGWQGDVQSWADDLPAYEREKSEWELADRIVTGSDFVRSGLVALGVPDEKIRVVPYGVDTSRFPMAPARPPADDGAPLRVLFAGEVGLRKGVPDLLHALDFLPHGAVEVRLAGAVALAADKLAPWRDRVSFLGAVPRPDMRELYQWADVFVLPSIVEGSATVTYEALMSGVPVIATPNVGSIVRDGVDGFIVPIRDPQALAEAIARYHENRTLLARHRKATEESRRIAGLDRYRSDLVRLVHDMTTDKVIAVEHAGSPAR